MRDFERNHPNPTLIDQKKYKERTKEKKKSNGFIQSIRDFDFKRNKKNQKMKATVNDAKETRQQLEEANKMIDSLRKEFEQSKECLEQTKQEEFLSFLKRAP